MKKGITREENYSKRYIILGIIAVLLVLSYFIIKPYLVPLISAFILAYLTKPIYNFLKPKIGKTLSSLACVILIILIVIIPVSILTQRIAQEGSYFITEKSINGAIEKISDIKILNPTIEKLSPNINKLYERLADTLISLLGSALSYLPSLFMSIFITLLGVFYILVGWDSTVKYIKDYIPFKDKDKIVKRISHATHAIIYGIFLIAIIEFILSTIFFYFIGVEYYLFFGTLVFFTSFIPLVGCGIVWVPLTIYYFLTGNYISAIAVLILGLIISIAIETILKGKIVGERSGINPLIMILGIIGGISLFGIFGFIIGPLILVYTLRLIHEFVSQRK